MIKKILFWLFVFAISFMIQSFGIAQQGTAFMVIHISVFVIGIVGSLFNIDELGPDAFKISVLFILNLCGSWLFSRVFNVDYSTTYQIIAFGSSIGD